MYDLPYTGKVLFRDSTELKLDLRTQSMVIF